MPPKRAVRSTTDDETNVAAPIQAAKPRKEVQVTSKAADVKKRKAEETQRKKDLKQVLSRQKAEERKASQQAPDPFNDAKADSKGMVAGGASDSEGDQDAENATARRSQRQTTKLAKEPADESEVEVEEAPVKTTAPTNTAPSKKSAKGEPATQTATTASTADTTLKGRKTGKAAPKRKKGEVDDDEDDDDNESLPTDSSEDGGGQMTMVKLKKRIDRHARWCPFVRIEKKMRYINRRIDRYDKMEAANTLHESNEAGPVFAENNEDGESVDDGETAAQDSQPAVVNAPAVKPPTAAKRTNRKGKNPTKEYDDNNDASKEKPGAATSVEANAEDEDEIASEEEIQRNGQMERSLSRKEVEVPIGYVANYRRKQQLAEQSTTAASESNVMDDGADKERTKESNAATGGYWIDNSSDILAPPDFPLEYDDDDVPPNTVPVHSDSELSDLGDDTLPPDFQRAYEASLAKPQAATSVARRGSKKRKASENQPASPEVASPAKRLKKLRGRPPKWNRKSEATISKDDPDA